MYQLCLYVIFGMPASFQ